MKNKLPDLNNHLFSQLERLSDESLKGDGLKEEISRAKAVSVIARNIVENAALMLEAQKALNDHVIEQVPELIGIEQKKHNGAKIHN